MEIYLYMFFFFLFSLFVTCTCIVALCYQCGPTIIGGSALVLAERGWDGVVAVGGFLDS